MSKMGTWSCVLLLVLLSSVCNASMRKTNQSRRPPILMLCTDYCPWGLIKGTCRCNMDWLPHPIKERPCLRKGCRRDQLCIEFRTKPMCFKKFRRDICDQEVDPGTGREVITRYHFEIKTGRCLPFAYSGSGGTKNNFLTIQECLSKCARRMRIPMFHA